MDCKSEPTWEYIHIDITVSSILLLINICPDNQNLFEAIKCVYDSIFSYITHERPESVPPWEVRDASQRQWVYVSQRVQSGRLVSTHVKQLFHRGPLSPWLRSPSLTWPWGSQTVASSCGQHDGQMCGGMLAACAGHDHS